MSSRDWVYSLSLLVPFVAYNLILKFLDIASRAGNTEPGETLRLMWSDIFFNLGYASLFLGLFAVARRGPAR
ncbi:MAG TPA: sulfatase, partial [Rubrobacteraceae bacterium]|nr:sulfatase [Rubrobacteraceae bacterium]